MAEKKADEFDHWYQIVRDWSGSAFIADEKGLDTSDSAYKSALYRDLCALGNYLLAWRDAERERPCTCHPSDNPPTPCARKFALGDCIVAKASDQ